MKKISICIPCYNEEGNIIPVYNAVKKEMDQLKNYDYEIIFADNASKDNTPAILRELARSDRKVKIIFNVCNFGPMRSGKNCVNRAKGDAIISLACDMQEPPELIPSFIHCWEGGKKVVLGKKNGSQENKVKFLLRKLFYKIIQLCSNKPQFDGVTGFGIQDKEVRDVVRDLNETDMPFRNIIAELGYEVELIPYIQKKRQKGKSSYNFFRYLDFAINSFVHTTKVPLRLATILGSCIALISFLVGLIYFIYKLLNWDSFQAGMAPILIGIFFLGSVQLLFIGIAGEYIGVILDKVTKRPLVIEKEVINFEKE